MNLFTVLTARLLSTATRRAHCSIWRCRSEACSSSRGVTSSRRPLCTVTHPIASSASSPSWLRLAASCESRAVRESRGPNGSCGDIARGLGCLRGVCTPSSHAGRTVKRSRQFVWHGMSSRSPLDTSTMATLARAVFWPSSSITTTSSSRKRCPGRSCPSLGLPFSSPARTTRGFELVTVHSCVFSSGMKPSAPAGRCVGLAWKGLLGELAASAAFFFVSSSFFFAASFSLASFFVLVAAFSSTTLASAAACSSAARAARISACSATSMTSTYTSRSSA